jgi:hypothetical protein
MLKYAVIVFIVSLLAGALRAWAADLASEAIDQPALAPAATAFA